MAQAADARCSEHADRTESAVLGIGRLLVHRMADLERAGLAAEVWVRVRLGLGLGLANPDPDPNPNPNPNPDQLVPVWLASLPLRHAEEEAAHEILRCFCTLLGGEAAQAALGAKGAWLG